MRECNCDERFYSETEAGSYKQKRARLPTPRLDEREKQRRLTGESEATEKAPEEIEDASLDEEEKISDAPPPKIVNKALTGRIPDHWKGNGK